MQAEIQMNYSSNKTILCKITPIESTSKRFMQMQKPRPKKNKIENESENTQITEQQSSPNSEIHFKEKEEETKPTEEEIQVDPLPQPLEENLMQPLLRDGYESPTFAQRMVSHERSLEEVSSPMIQQEVAQRQKDVLISQGNFTENYVLPKERYPREQYSNEHYTKEAQATNLTMKGLISNIEELSDKTNIKIEKSQALTESWKDHIKSLDAYIKSKDLSKYLKWAACITTIGLFIFKMGLARKIPDFLFSTLSNITIPSVQTMSAPLQSAGSVVKPQESTLHILMETPLTPLGVLTGVGTLTLTVGLFKVILYALKFKR